MSAKAQPIREPPVELKSVKPFILRGNQLRTADPVITYYCYFWAIKHILGNGLHTISPECTSWTTDLMDELEKRKAALESNELIHDNMAAQAYVENFALKIFNNGATVVENGKATGQTSDTLLASATLLEVCKVFGDLDQEALQKIKFAKFHAARIWKALSTGQDPNPPKAPVTEDPRGPPPDIYGNEPQYPPPPTIEEVADESAEPELNPTRSSIYDEPPPAYPLEPVSTLPMTENLPSPPRSLGPEQEGYFPSAPTAHEPSVPNLFSATMPTNTPFQNTGEILFPKYQQPPTQAPYPQDPARNNVTLFPQPRQYQEQVRHASPPVQLPPKRAKKEITQEDITKAQKHAKWAISALDYEDVETAVTQFRLGLQLLGIDD